MAAGLEVKSLKAEEFTGNDVIMDYRSGFSVLQSVVGTDLVEYYTSKEHLTSEISRMERRCQETELWIDQIPDSITRRIFRMYYEDGQSQQNIAKQMHIDQSIVSRKISKYLYKF